MSSSSETFSLNILRGKDSFSQRVGQAVTWCRAEGGREKGSHPFLSSFQGHSPRDRHSWGARCCRSWAFGGSWGVTAPLLIFPHSGLAMSFPHLLNEFLFVQNLHTFQNDAAAESCLIFYILGLLLSSSPSTVMLMEFHEHVSTMSSTRSPKWPQVASGLPATLQPLATVAAAVDCPSLDRHKSGC